MTSEWTTPARAARFRHKRRLLKHHTLGESEHANVTRRFGTEGVRVALDVGCGVGRLSALLKTASIQPVGVDLSPDLAPRAARHANVARADVPCQSFGRNTFSAATALCMLYVFADPKVVLAEIRRVLRPGGLLSVSAPSRNWPTCCCVAVQPTSTARTHSILSGESSRTWRSSVGMDRSCGCPREPIYWNTP